MAGVLANKTPPVIRSMEKTDTHQRVGVRDLLKQVNFTDNPQAGANRKRPCKSSKLLLHGLLFYADNMGTFFNYAVCIKSVVIFWIEGALRICYN